MTFCVGLLLCFLLVLTPTGHPFSLRFQCQHSSSQAESVALRLACGHLGNFGRFHRITFVSDSQPALKAICHRQGVSELAVVAYQAMGGLHRQFQEMQLWWTSRHVDLHENDVADMAANHVAQGIGLTAISEELLQRQTTLNSVIYRHYAQRFDAQWALSSIVRQLFDTTPTSLAPWLAQNTSLGTTWLLWPNFSREITPPTSTCLASH